MRKKCLAQVAIALVYALAALSVHANIVVMDFDSKGMSGDHVYGPAYLDGFRLSPNGHIDILGPGYFPGMTSLGIGTDGAEWAPNRYFVGPSELAYAGIGSTGWIYIDLPGRTFDLASFLTIGGGGQVKSSKGGSVTWSGWSEDAYRSVILSGPEWTDVAWIALSGFSGEPINVYDNITFRVSEPATLALVLFACVGLIGAPRRRLKS